jgi:hypothetical protein
MALKGGGIMRGEIVIARAFGDQMLVRRVWEATERVVYLSDEAEFNKLLAGKEALTPIGFPAGDVFAYDEAFARETGKLKWSLLTRYNYRTTERPD